VIEDLTVVATDVCGHCGGRIVRLDGDLGSSFWTHPVGAPGEESLGYRAHCPTATVAAPVDEVRDPGAATRRRRLLEEAFQAVYTRHGAGEYYPLSRVAVSEWVAAAEGVLDA
jgi:hypothetical protein